MLHPNPILREQNFWTKKYTAFQAKDQGSITYNSLLELQLFLHCLLDILGRFSEFEIESLPCKSLWELGDIN